MGKLASTEHACVIITHRDDNGHPPIASVMPAEPNAAKVQNARGKQQESLCVYIGVSCHSLHVCAAYGFAGVYRSMQG
jgi:hypothetical protein